MIVGAVGSGKSTLLHMILRELPCSSGHVEVTGTVSYASQDPWLFVGKYTLYNSMAVDNKLFTISVSLVFRISSTEHTVWTAIRKVSLHGSVQSMCP